MLVSGWLIIMDPIINRDAIIYLRAADAYLLSGLDASLQIYGRPTLSICMALLQQWTGLPILYGGLLLVSLAYAVMCTGFVATVHTLGGDRRVQWLAAIVILSHPMLNHTRSAIMRDPIYWALLILALREMLLYIRQPTYWHQLRWVSWVFLAILFRFEGLFFAVLSPLLLLFCKDMPGRLRHCLRLLLPQLAAIVVVGIVISVYFSQQGETGTLFPAINKYLDRLMALPQEMSMAARLSAHWMLQFTSREDGLVAVLAGLTAVLVLNICRALTWPWLLVLLWGRAAHLLHRFRSDDHTILKGHMLISLGYLALFLLVNRFILERYINQLVLFLLLYLPFLLNQLWTAGGWRKYVTIALLLGMSLDTLHNGDRDKLFIRDATEWVVENTPEGARIISNDKYIAYFSQREIDWGNALRHEFKWQAITEPLRNWESVDYLVIYVRNRDDRRWDAFMEANGFSELKSFQGDNIKKGRVVIVAA